MLGCLPLECFLIFQSYLWMYEHVNLMWNILYPRSLHSSLPLNQPICSMFVSARFHLLGRNERADECNYFGSSERIDSGWFIVHHTSIQTLFSCCVTECFFLHKISFNNFCLLTLVGVFISQLLIEKITNFRLSNKTCTDVWLNRLVINVFFFHLKHQLTLPVENFAFRKKIQTFLLDGSFEDFSDVFNEIYFLFLNISGDWETSSQILRLNGRPWSLVRFKFTTFSGNSQANRARVDV